MANKLSATSGAVGTGVTAVTWSEIGAYLCKDRVQLLTPQSHQRLRDDWREIQHQEETLEDAILIGLVGGTGVGKSTLINALAGQEVSRSSDRRPTTDRVVVYRHVATELSGEVPDDDLAQPPVLHDNGKLEKVILFDFPDFDSAEESHTHIIRRYLPHLDVLLVVVDDVKYADRRLYELLSTLDHDPENIFVVMNKVDRLERRYGEQTPRVIVELLEDLRDKLRVNSNLVVRSDQQYAVAALPVFDSRVRHESTTDARFSQLEQMLEGFQVQKHRRAAKSKNIDARKLALSESLVQLALGADNVGVLSEAEELVGAWRVELDKALQVVPVDVLTDGERRGVRRSFLRQRGPRWGLPFSLFFTLLGEWQRKGTQTVEPTELGPRVFQHYRSFFEAIKNVQARFRAEFTGAKLQPASMRTAVAPINDTSAAGDAPTTALASSLRGTGITPSAVSDLARPLQQSILRETPAPGSRKFLAHVPAIVALLLALWSRVHPIMAAAVGTSESSVVWSVIKSLVGTLSPTFLIGTLLGVVFVYALTGAVIWLREIQKLDIQLTEAERDTRHGVRQYGLQAVDQLDADVKQLHDEFEQVRRAVGK